MRTRLIERIARLEAASKRFPRVLLQYGWLRKLPNEYQGERHVAIVKRLSIRDDLEWIEAEEVEGRASQEIAAERRQEVAR